MQIDLVPIWTLIIGVGVFMYVLLDGFDLGVGMLSPLALSEDERTLMMNTVAPVWDGNQTWLVLGGTALLAAFPLAFAILIPALYFPVMLMLLGLILRGVAFEFRLKSIRGMPWWNRSFYIGSFVATFFQGVVLGNFVQGFAVDGRHFAGGSFDWIRPFPLLTGVGLIFGYALLGATWLVMKTEGELQQRSRRQASLLLFGVLAFIVMVSIWTPFLNDQIARRWFSWPNMAYFGIVPVVTALIAYATWHTLHAGGEATPFLGAMGLFVMCYLGLVISVFPYIVPYSVTLWQAAASPNSMTFLLVGTMFLIPLVFLYTFWSYYVFRGKIRADTGYH
jgi:cytochrome d ubiquinol oxidase subunit II